MDSLNVFDSEHITDEVGGREKNYNSYNSKITQKEKTVQKLEIFVNPRVREVVDFRVQRGYIDRYQHRKDYKNMLFCCSCLFSVFKNYKNHDLSFFLWMTVNPE